MPDPRPELFQEGTAGEGGAIGEDRKSQNGGCTGAWRSEWVGCVTSLGDLSWIQAPILGPVDLTQAAQISNFAGANSSSLIEVVAT